MVAPPTPAGIESEIGLTLKDLSPDENKVSAITNYSSPKSVKQGQQHLGMVSKTLSCKFLQLSGAHYWSIFMITPWQDTWVLWKPMAAFTNVSYDLVWEPLSTAVKHANSLNQASTSLQDSWCLLKPARADAKLISARGSVWGGALSLVKTKELLLYIVIDKLHLLPVNLGDQL